MMKTIVSALVLVFIVLGGGGGLVPAAAAAESLSDKCGKEFPKVVPCLSYATGKAAAASKECCDAVSSIKDTDPACLCFVIQQVHSGDNAQVKSMGIQEARLLQLPSACKLTNASITNCPKLLNLPANSPDAKMFTDASDSAASTTTKSPGGSSPGTAAPATAGGGSYGFKHSPQLAGVPFLAAAVVVILAGFWASP